MLFSLLVAWFSIKVLSITQLKSNCWHFSPFGQADLLCCSAFAVYEYGFMRCASHINL